MKLKILFLSFLLLTVFIFSQEDEEMKKEDSKKYSDYFNLTLRSKTEIEFSLIDTSDDSEQIDIGPDKNSPKITEEIYAFVRIKRFSNKNFIFGPYVNSEFEMKIDNKKINNAYYLFFEEFNNFSDLGIKIGFDFDKEIFKGSCLTFSLPLSLKFDVYDKDNGRDVPQGIKELNYFSHFYIGTNPSVDLKLISKPKFISFNLSNSTLFAPEIINVDYKKGFNFYLMNSNTIKFSIAPFNYINERIELWFTLYNKFDFYYDSYNAGLKERAYFNIVWKGLKRFEIFYKPIVYNFGLKIPNFDYSLAYDQKNRISMEIGASFNNKFVEFTLSYEPTLWAIDGAFLNTDSVKPHIFKASLELKY